MSREDEETDGTATLRADIEGRAVLISTGLRKLDYDRAIQAHKDNALIVVDGDLERVGDRWRFRNARIVDVISDGSDDGNPNRTS